MSEIQATQMMMGYKLRWQHDSPHLTEWLDALPSIPRLTTSS